MTPLASALLLATAACALGSWVGVATGRTRLEYFCKPATMACLAAMAVALQPRSQGQRWLFAVALLLGLAGDVFLMLPKRDLLIAGLLAFLAGHLAYIAGFRFLPFEPVPAAAAVLLVVVTAALLLPRYIGALRSSGRDQLVLPVLVYVVVISGTVVSAAGSANPVAIAGAGLFYFSDVLFAWYRFVGPLRWGRPVNIVMYQLGQALLALSLATG